MKYYTADELKTTNKEGAHEILDECDAQLVKFHFGIEAFKNWHKKLFNGNKQVKVLDLGTGSGGFARQLADMDCAGNLYGTDIDDYRKNEIKPLYREFKAADLSWDSIPWPDNTFDIVTAWCVLPHLENPFYCVREVNRVLKNNGLFIFSVLHIASKSSADYFRKNRSFPHYRPTNNHIALFPNAVVKSAILKNFELVDTEYAVRPKIFQGSIKNKIRAIVYALINKYWPAAGKALRRRWAYDAIYTIRKKL